MPNAVENDEEIEDQVVDQVEQEEQHDEAAEAQQVVISLGEEPEPEPVPDNKAIRQLRERIKELNKREREERQRRMELEARLAPAPQLGPKPTIQDAEYDADRFEAALLAWNERKRQVEQAQAQAQQQQIQAQQSWQQATSRYVEAKRALPVTDYEDAEAAVDHELSEIQRGIIVAGSAKPAEVVYVLGKNPERLAELAKIHDPVRFAVEIGKLEMQVKKTEKSKPAPEGKVVGTAVSGTSDRHLERLRAEAEKTGDYTKVRAYKQSLRE